MTHPLTDDICDDLSSCITILTAPGDPDPYICPQYVADDMRAAADWQLEQVMNWLDEHLINYSDDDYCGRCASINDLEDHLKKAMRPQENIQ